MALYMVLGMIGFFYGCAAVLDAAYDAREMLEEEW